MGLRYSFEATLTRILTTHNSDGDPVSSNTTVTFPCDYQPDAKEIITNANGDSVPVKYKIFVDKTFKDSVFDFTFDNTFGFEMKIGDKISVDGQIGVIVNIFRYSLNTEIWVK